MSIIDISVRRPVTVWMFTFAVILFGLVSLGRLVVELLPELSYPTLTIRTDYAGAAPAEVEQLVTKPVEEAIGIVKGVRKVHSISKAGQSDVALEFEWGTDMDMASLEVREKLDVITLPLDVKKPLLLKFNPNLDPIVRLALQRDQTADDEQARQLKALREYADEELKRKLEAVQGVASVKIGGGYEKEIKILIDQQKTAQLGISNEDIVKRLQQENLNQSGGRVRDGGQEYLVRTINKFQTLDDIANVYLKTIADTHIRVSDIAQVVDSHKERSSITRINGEEAIEVALYREGDANTVATATKIKQALVQIEKSLPQHYKIVQVYDQSTFIANAINEVKSAAVFGGLLAMLVLFFFLKNIWTTIIISISIPVSVIATFNLMYGNGVSLNIMSLGGIALAVGLLVDNAIVVLENISRHKETHPDAKWTAALATKEVSSAIIASTLTTMAVFFPLVFVEGIAGQLFSDQALTVTFALLASLFVALTLIPMLASRGGQNTDVAIIQEPSKPTAPEPAKTGIGRIWHWLTLPLVWLVKAVFYYLPFTLTVIVTTVAKFIRFILAKLMTPLLWLFDQAYQRILLGYQATLSWALRARILILFSIIGISTASLPVLTQLPVELIPPMTQGEFYVEVKHAPGTKLNVTDASLKQLSELALANNKVDRVSALAGTGSLMNASPAQGGDYWGKLNVMMKPHSSAEDENVVIEQIRQHAQQMPGVAVNIGRPELFSFSTPLAIEIAAYDLALLKSTSDKIVDLLSQSSRFVDVNSTLQVGHPEVKIYFNHSRLAQLGLSAPDVARRVAGKIGGSVASQYSIDDRKVDILVQVAEKDRNSVDDIKTMIVNPGQRPAVPLSSVADVVLSLGPSEITRIDQQRVAVVSANIGYGDLGQATLEAQQLLTQLKLPIAVQVKITGQNEEMEVSFTSLKFALALAVFLVYLVMASQFESLLHPLFILFTVPLAGAGSIFGLYLTATPLSVIVFIGLIMLAGIVVNNAIVLVDRINQLRSEGIDKALAIEQAAENRFRPILMTTLTTTLGLLPLALSGGEGAEMRAPMAISVIFGLGFASLLTLYFIPVLYSLFDQKQFNEVQQQGVANEFA